MKKLLVLFFVAAAFVACNESPKEGDHSNQNADQTADTASAATDTTMH